MGVLTAYTDALQNLIPAKLLDDDPIMEDSWNKLVDYLSKSLEALKQADKTISPVGMIYLQLPGKALPDSMWQGTSWSDVSATFAGGFFRAKGGAADNTGARQGDAIRNIVGKFGRGSGPGYFDISSGAFSLAGPSSGIISYGGGYNIPHAVDFNAAYVVPTASENRPVNYAITVWQCTAG